MSSGQWAGGDDVFGLQMCPFSKLCPRLVLCVCNQTCRAWSKGHDSKEGLLLFPIVIFLGMCYNHSEQKV